MSAQILSYPLTMPLISATAGGIAGFTVFAKRRGNAWSSKPLLAVLVAVALGAALVPFAGQLLYDIGLSDSARLAFTYVSYALVGFGLVGAWLLLHPSRVRWLLVALIPLSLFHAGSWAFAYYIWGTRGFGP